MKNFTELESLVLTELTKRLNIEEIGFSDVFDKDLENATKIPMKALRGVLGSLVRKNVLSISSWQEMGLDNNRFGNSIVYLREEAIYLFNEFC